MKKEKGQSYLVVQKYRVECNHGSKYFMNDDQACGYIDYMEACGFEAELWLVRSYYDECGNKVKSNQVWLDLEAVD